MGLRSFMNGTIDAHLHLVSFLQDCKGMELLLLKMNYANVERAVVSGLPVTKAWVEYDSQRPRYPFDNDAPAYFYSYTDQIVVDRLHTLPAEQRERFAPLICGFNPTDRCAIDHIERVYNNHPHLWKGIGEVFFRHSFLSHLIPGETARPDHPAMLPIYEFAGAKGLPMLVHQDISSVEDRENPVYLQELENALRLSPHTAFVWAHCGCTDNVYIHHQAKEVERLLNVYPNLFCDISWAVFEQVIYRDRTLSKTWVELIEKYSERFCLGSDVAGSFDSIPAEINKYAVLVERLSPKARKNLLHGTAGKLYFS